MAKQAIPHKISFGPNGHIHIEFFRRDDAACIPGSGYMRTFDSADWPRAAAYVQELKGGNLSGQY